jgi:hypothetical protein
MASSSRRDLPVPGGAMVTAIRKSLFVSRASDERVGLAFDMYSSNCASARWRVGDLKSPNCLLVRRSSASSTRPHCAASLSAAPCAVQILCTALGQLLTH